MKLTAIPFRDAFPKYRWAQHEIFNGYLAVIPAEGNADSRAYNRARRANLRRILALAIEELECSSPSSSHGPCPRQGNPRNLLARLKRVKVAKLVLPRWIRVRYCEEIRTYHSRHDDTRKLTGISHTAPVEKLVKLQQLIDLGLRLACACQTKEAFELDNPDPGEFYDHGLV